MKGTVIYLGDIRTGTSQSGKEWSTRDFVIEWGGEHIEKAVLTAFPADKTANLRIGQTVDCSVNFKAKEYNGRWFNTIDVWKVEVVGEPAASPVYYPEPAKMPDANDGEDLPF